ncbi:peptidase [Sulfoacidibacillus thermotolerans]|uniref:Peptidase n=1 Tax=Sulfoacidibacillus thermotolerans TaxID=1765684 RepID=A0A2U3D6N4_SULT2|nr:peptidase [Sulfoacidibacillus thermotolerans]
MPEVKQRIFGSWESPITSDLIVSGASELQEITLDENHVYWLEGRPTEGGRNVLVKRTETGEVIDLTPQPFNVRTRVHEYGGGAYTVKNGVVYFSNFSDGRVYRLTEQGIEPITPDGAYRYADFTVDTVHQQLICVREDHTGSGEAVNALVAIALDGSNTVRVLVEGSDFYSSARISPDGLKMAWLAWNHPNMPWDGTELFEAEFNLDGTLSQAIRVAGGKEESVFQPEWSPLGDLYYVSDRTNWWNLYRYAQGRTEIVVQKAVEFGMPQWVFGMSTYGFLDEFTIFCTYNDHGQWSLAMIHLSTGELQTLDSHFTAVRYVRAAQGSACFIGGSPTMPTAIVRYVRSHNEFTLLRESTQLMIDPEFLSIPEVVEFPTSFDRTAYGFFYAPASAEFDGPPTDRPPLIVMCHGGPTSAASTTFHLHIQYWTSRGFAVLDVNYGGSTGYGREYRQRLNGNWGIVDVDDCTNGALYLVQRGDVRSDQLAIRGGSAGGYTTLSALTFRDVFSAGASYYGVSDIELLAKETHKFESRYMDSMVGPYPELRDVYVARSPLYALDQLHAPVIFFQGLDDKIVLPNQAELMVEGLRKKGVPVAYVAFEGEGHGFRKADHIKKTLDAELYFYSKVFGFSVPFDAEPVEIENL